MTPLGLSERELVAALTRYLRLVQSVEEVAQAQAIDALPQAEAGALDDLNFALDVDIATRRSVNERSIMSPLEARHFVPWLERLRQQLAPLQSSAPSPAWIAPLRAAEGEIETLLHRFGHG